MQKKRIALIRRSTEEQAVLPEAFQELGIPYTDICIESQVMIDTIDGRNSQVTVFLDAIPLQDFALVFYLNFPFRFEDMRKPSRSELFIMQEKTQAFLAALASLPRTRVINPGLVFSWNKTLQNQSFFKYELAKLGLPVENERFQMETCLAHHPRNGVDYSLFLKANRRAADDPLDQVGRDKLRRFLALYDLDWILVGWRKNEGQAIISRIIADGNELNIIQAKNIIETLIL